MQKERASGLGLKARSLRPGTFFKACPRVRK
jgi:hypothetical protein